MRTSNFMGMGFFGRMPFGCDMDNMREKWVTMTPEEKQRFFDERMRGGHDDRDGFPGRREFSVSDFDQRCEAWMKKTPEEKEAFVNERKEAMQHFPRCGFFAKGRMFCEHGFREDDRHYMREKWSKMTDEEKQAFIRMREGIMFGGEDFFGKKEAEAN